MTRSGLFWERADLARYNLPEKKLEQFLTKLPSCVNQLRIGSSSASQLTKISVPRLYHILLERFPNLSTLIIENSILQNPFIHMTGINGFIINLKLPMDHQIRKYYSLVGMVYYPTEVDSDFNTLVNLLRHLTVLSLRHSILAVEFREDFVQPLSSKIKVLDLTNCMCAVVQTIKQFVQLPLLEELYLAGTPISVNGVETVLKEVPNLKVLDLDDTIVAHETFTVLRNHGKKLVAIYLGKTAVKDSDMIEIDEGTFPVLTKLCLQRTAITEIGVKKLLLAVPSLTHIFLTKSKVKITWMLDQSAFVRGKLKYDDSDETEECNHFLQNKFGGKF